MSTDKSQESQLHMLDYWQVLRNRYAVILLAFFLVFLTAAVITYLMPKEYEGRVKMEIKRQDKVWDIFQTGAIEPGQADFRSSTWLRTQFEIMSSQKLLYLVVNKLNLKDRWNLRNDRQAYRRLKGNLDAKEVRASDLIDIVVYDTDAQLAAEMANAIAQAYKDYRSTFEKQKSDTALAVLDAQLKGQYDKMEGARLKMLDLMERYRIIDFAVDVPSWMRGDAETDTGIAGLVRKSMFDLDETKRTIDEIKTQLGALRDLSGDELIQSSAGLGIVDSTVTNLYPEYQRLKITLTQFEASGLGPNHPDVMVAKGSVEQARKMLESGAANIKKTLQTRLEIAQQIMERAEKAHEGKEADSMEDRRKNIEYNQAKKHYALEKDLYKQMQEKLYAERIDLTLPKIPVRIHEEAEVADRWSRPNVTLNMILGAIVGLIFGLGLALALEYMDTSVKSLEDVEKYLQVPVLAVIPQNVGILHKQSGLSPDAEAYRILRTNIEFNRKSADANSITVVSGGAGEGKSTTLVNLAYICAQGGYNTLMIDGDLRRPKLHTFFDINNSVGLTNYLTTELMLEDVILQTPVDNLYFMPSGILPADAAGILNSRRMSELIMEVKNRFDLVLIDSPPILGVSDAAVLASEVDLTLLVIQHRKLPRQMLGRVKGAVENVGGTLLGVVLNNVDVRSDSQYQYYTSYYTYYSPVATDSRRPSRKKGAAKPAESEPVATESVPSSGDDDAY